MIPVVNMTLEEATRVLNEMSLRVGSVRREPSEQYEEGKVSAQSVLPNSIVMEGTAIDLVVSTGIVVLPPPGITGTPAPAESGTPDPDVTSAPGPQETPEVTATPAPTPSAPTHTSRRDVTVDLPSDRETVTVRVTVGGVEQIHGQVVETRMRMARFTVEASGVQQIVVYLDDEPVKDYTEDFGS